MENQEELFGKEVSKILDKKVFVRIHELMFEDSLIEGQFIEFSTIEELIERYKDCLTEEQLQQLKDLGYGC